MPSVASRRRLNESITALSRFSRSRQLDSVHAERSGVDLNLAAYGVLGQIITAKEVSLSDLAGLARMQPPALSRQVKLLEERSFLERTLRPDDTRISMVRPTPAGRDAHRRIRSANDDLLARQLKGWTDHELNELSNQIFRLVNDLRRT